MAERKAGKGQHKVIGQVAVVTVLDGSERYLYRGAVFDAAQADAGSVKHLIAVGLLEAVKAAAPSAAEKAAAPSAAEKAAAPSAADAAAAEKAKADTAAAAEKAAGAKPAAAK